MKRNLTTIFALSLFIMACQPDVKVACIGDSITNGGGWKEADFYPVQLSTILGSGYSVLNFGEGGATMQTDANKPYWKQKDLFNVFAYQPDIVVIMLGTNDSKTYNWNALSYERDYQRMIDTLTSMSSVPAIYLCIPPPAYSDRFEISDSTLRAGVIPAVERLAKKNGLNIIDMYKALSDKSDLFGDGIHPNEEGKRIMAETVAKEIGK